MNQTLFTPCGRWAALLLATLVTAGSLRAQATFQELSAVPAAGEPFSGALAISADGQTVAGYARSTLTADGRQAALWSHSATATALGSFATHNLWGHARNLSPDGTTIVGSTSLANDERAFRWTQAGGLELLAALPGAFASDAHGVSAGGNVIAGRSRFRDETGNYALLLDEATVWINGAAQGLGHLGTGRMSAAMDVSENGRVVVGTADPSLANDGASVAFYWTQSTGLINLGDLPGGYERAVATAVDKDGQTVVGWSLKTYNHIQYRVFRWTRAAGQMTELGALPGHFHAMAADVSSHGDYIVGWSSPDLSGTVRKPFLWDATYGMQDITELAEGYGIDLSDWRDQFGRIWMEATGVSSDGKTIVGHGRKYAENTRRGFVITLP